MNFISQQWKLRSLTRAGAGLLVLGILMTAPVARAQISNVIWKANFSGSLSIQQFDANLNPRQESAGFSTPAFLRMVLGTSVTNEILALSASLQGSNSISVSLSVFDTAARQSVTNIGTSTSGIVLSDGTNFVFTADIPMPALSTVWQGGYLKLAGRGGVIRGAPVKLQANVEGILIDARPTDIGGTTGILTRATIQTVGPPLRVQPVVVP